MFTNCQFCLIYIKFVRQQLLVITVKCSIFPFLIHFFVVMEIEITFDQVNKEVAGQQQRCWCCKNWTFSSWELHYKINHEKCSCAGRSMRFLRQEGNSINTWSTNVQIVWTSNKAILSGCILSFSRMCTQYFVLKISLVLRIH